MNTLYQLQNRTEVCNNGTNCLRYFYPHMPIGKVWIYRLLFVCSFVCTVTDFSAEDKTSGSHRIYELCSLEVQNRTKRLARGPRTPLQYIARSPMGMCGYRSVPTGVLVKIWAAKHNGIFV